MPDRPKRWPPPWLFLILILPGGVFYSFTSTPLPFLLSKAEVAVDQIANLGALLQIPTIFYFLWAPLVDMKLRRRTWLVITAFLSAGCLGIAMPLISADHLTLITVLLIAGMTINVLVSAAHGGLMVSSLTRASQATASGWTQAGNVGGGAVGAGVTLWLIAHVPLPIAVLATTAMAALPALAALTISESLPTSSAGFLDHLRSIGKELVAVFRSSRT